MKTVLGSPAGLYPRLIGDSWRDLDDAIRWFHGSGPVVHAAGVFQVRHGSGRLVRSLAWLARLPRPSEAAEVRLRVTAEETGEEWRRTFAGRLLVSRQSSRSDGLLAERMGAAELRFRLGVVDGALNYQTERVALCLGPLRVPLPRWLGPRVSAWERPGDVRDRIDVSVQVKLPVLGLLVAYGGNLTLVEAQG